MKWGIAMGTLTATRWLGISITMLALSFPPVSAQSCDYFNYTMDPNQVVPATQVQGHGWSELHLCDDDSLRGYIGLNIVGTVTAVHIHGPADPGENGEILYELPLPDPVYQSLPVLLGPVPDGQQEWFVFEKCYVDVHTFSHPEGAIRGQIHHEVAVTRETWTTVKCRYR